MVVTGRVEIVLSAHITNDPMPEILQRHQPRRAPGVPEGADETANWEDRCGEAFARVAADPDEVNLEQFIDLPHLRGQAAIDVGRTRARLQGAPALKKAGAPEYAPLVVEGGS
jgi:hypothetical protein